MENLCTLCPRNCGVDRRYEVGRCKVGAEIEVARASLHKWEEPILSGKNGSGTVFFSGCNLGCVYCQNKELSLGKKGKVLSPNELSDLYFRLEDAGAENINLVTGTHFTTKIAESLKIAKEKGLTIPFVWNTSSYEKRESLKMLDSLVDIYLADFRYWDTKSAIRYSHAHNYPLVAKLAFREMFSQTGSFILGQNGMLKKGMIARVLVLPNHTKEAICIIRYLYEKYSDAIYISIMSQYTPFGNLLDYREIDRKLTKEEYDNVVNFAAGIGVMNAFTQEAAAADESFIPNFDDGVFLKK